MGCRDADPKLLWPSRMKGMSSTGFQDSLCRTSLSDTPAAVEQELIKAVKSTCAYRWWRIYFYNDIMHCDAASVLKTRPKELGSRTIWVREFNVHITMFYRNIVCNNKVPFIIIRTSIKWSRLAVLSRQNSFFLLNK